MGTQAQVPVVDPKVAALEEQVKKDLRRVRSEVGLVRANIAIAENAKLIPPQSKEQGLRGFRPPTRITSAIAGSDIPSPKKIAGAGVSETPTPRKRGGNDRTPTPKK